MNNMNQLKLFFLVLLKVNDNLSDCSCFPSLYLDFKGVLRSLGSGLAGSGA